MIACEPSDSVLAALLQANDDLLAAVNSWDTTASRLVMLQSRSLAPAPEATQRQHSASSRVTAAPEVSDSSSSSTSASDMTPATAASGGVFWSHLDAVPNVQLPGSTSQQQAQQAQQQQQHRAQVRPSPQQSYPSLLDDGPAQGQHAASTQQQHGSSQRQSSRNSHFEDVAGLQPQYPHQSLVSQSHQQVYDDSSWQDSLGAGASMPTALPSNSTQSEGQSGAVSRADRVQEYRGSVLNYRLATPKHSDQQQSPFFEESADEAPRRSSQPWPEAEAQASSSSAGQQPFDPFAGTSTTHASEYLF